MKRLAIIKAVISFAALIIGTMRICYPSLNIDSITLGLFAVAVLPWLQPVFKSLEFPGGMKVQLQDFKEIEEKAYRAGLIENNANSMGTKGNTFLIVAKEDPKLALAGLRIELEDKLRKIASKNELDINNQELGKLMRELSAHYLISQEEKAVISDMVAILNSAVHSRVEKYDYIIVTWALDLGTKVLYSLDKRLEH